MKHPPQKWGLAWLMLYHAKPRKNWVCIFYTISAKTTPEIWKGFQDLNCTSQSKPNLSTLSLPPPGYVITLFLLELHVKSIFPLIFFLMNTWSYTYIAILFLLRCNEKVWSRWRGRRYWSWCKGNHTTSRVLLGCTSCQTKVKSLWGGKHWRNLNEGIRFSFDPCVNAMGRGTCKLRSVLFDPNQVFCFHWSNCHLWWHLYVYFCILSYILSVFQWSWKIDVKFGPWHFKIV